MNRFLSVLLTFFLLSCASLDEYASHPTTWQVGDEVGIRAGCIKYEDILSVVKLGKTDYELATQKFIALVEMGECFIIPYPVKGILNKIVYAPVLVSTKPEYTGSLWEVGFEDSDMKVYAIFSDKEGPHKFKKDSI